MFKVMRFITALKYILCFPALQLFANDLSMIYDEVSVEPNAYLSVDMAVPRSEQFGKQY